MGAMWLAASCSDGHTFPTQPWCITSSTISQNKQNLLLVRNLFTEKIKKQVTNRPFYTLEEDKQAQLHFLHIVIIIHGLCFRSHLQVTLSTCLYFPWILTCMVHKPFSHQVDFSQHFITATEMQSRTLSFPKRIIEELTSQVIPTQLSFSL